jgi:hypothetical protein
MNQRKPSQFPAKVLLGVLGAILSAKALPLTAAAGTGPTAVGPYKVSVFAPAPPGLSNPDSITMVQGKIFVTYANGATPDGSSGSSTVVEFSTAGQVIRAYTVQGKNDGLKYNRYDRTLWALRNEDGNPALTILNPKTAVSSDLTFAAPPAHGGGYDDAAFLNGKIYITASNPTVDASGQNHFPSIVMAVRPRFAEGRSLWHPCHGQSGGRGSHLREQSGLAQSIGAIAPFEQRHCEPSDCGRHRLPDQSIGNHLRRGYQGQHHLRSQKRCVSGRRCLLS